MPDPDAPIRQTTWCRSTVRSIPCSTSRSPKRFVTFSSVTKCELSRRHTRLGPLALLALLDQVVREAGERDREDDEEHGRDGEARVVEVVGGVEARLRGSLGEAEDGDERGVLLQADEVVQERRDDTPDRLRQDDEPERLRVAQSERAGRHALARMHGLDACAVHLGHVRRVDERQRDDPVDEERLVRDDRRCRAPGRRGRR